MEGVHVADKQTWWDNKGESEEVQSACKSMWRTSVLASFAYTGRPSSWVGILGGKISH